MASVNPAPESRYPQEAGLFLSTMGEMAPQMALDYSVESLQRLEQFIIEYFEGKSLQDIGDTLPLRVGCYVGEVIIRHLGGHWNQDGLPEINNVGPLDVIYPIEKARKRFEVGKAESLAWYYHSVTKQVYEANHSLSAVGAGGRDSGEGLLGLFKGIFKK